MSEKKQVKSAAPAPVVAQKKAVPKVILRDAKGRKIMAIARGTERAIRRMGLVKGWRTIKGAKQMAPSAEQLAAEKLASAAA